MQYHFARIQHREYARFRDQQLPIATDTKIIGPFTEWSIDALVEVDGRIKRPSNVKHLVREAQDGVKWEPFSLRRVELHRDPHFSTLYAGRRKELNENAVEALEFMLEVGPLRRGSYGEDYFRASNDQITMDLRIDERYFALYIAGKHNREATRLANRIGHRLRAGLTPMDLQRAYVNDYTQQGLSYGHLQHFVGKHPLPWLIGRRKQIVL